MKKYTSLMSLHALKYLQLRIIHILKGHILGRLVPTSFNRMQERADYQKIIKRLHSTGEGVLYDFVLSLYFQNKYRSKHNRCEQAAAPMGMSQRPNIHNQVCKKINEDTSRVRAAILAELPGMSYSSNSQNVKWGKLTFGLGLEQHCILNNCLQS